MPLRAKGSSSLDTTCVRHQTRHFHMLHIITTHIISILQVIKLSFREVKITKELEGRRATRI